MRRLFLTVLFLAVSATGFCQTGTFTISDIRVEGLERISEGTVFSYLPVEVGDALTPGDARLVVRELYRAGFFHDIALSREGDILIITVSERPAIAAVSIDGNKQIKSEDIMPALAQIGIAEGEVFNPASVEQVEQELIRTYFNQGRYGVNVDTEIRAMERNRVDISINVSEGKQSRIRHINIVGNESFSDKEVRDDWESDTKRGLAFWRGRTQYSREKTQGDLETLASFYLDRGYLDFNIESSQVSISPDKQDIFITVNIREGEVYTVNKVDLTGEMILPEPVLRNLVMLESGDTFSRKKLEQTTENISAVLANIGYAFANVNPIPDIDREGREVGLNFFVDPGKRVHVRRIEFQGNTRTRDEVLRREMRQFEGAWFSQIAVDRSRLRLQRLGYFEEVNIETPAVEGTDDQIDVVVSVEERPTGQFNFMVGYSRVQKFIVGFSLSQDNFLGSGKRLGLSIQRSRVYQDISLSYTDPYFTDDGVQLGYTLRYSKLNQSRANISAFTTSTAAAGVHTGFPITEVDFLRFGASYRRTDVGIGDLTFLPFDPDDEDCEFGDLSCGDFARVANRPLAITLKRDNLECINDDSIPCVLSSRERRIHSYQLDTSWSRNSTNHYLNPNRGSRQTFGIEVALPGSTRQWYKVNYRGAKYWPLPADMSFSLRTDIAHGDAYDDHDRKLNIEDIPPEDFLSEEQQEVLRCHLGDVVSMDDGLPFWEHYYAGGVSGDVRGFNDYSLGPKDQFCRSVGGDFKFVAGAEVGFPIPFADVSGVRLAWFLDVGNVFRNYSEFKTSELRASTGLSLTWESPMGPIVINLSRPVREQEGDRTEVFQFSLGAQF